MERNSKKFIFWKRSIDSLLILNSECLWAHSNSLQLNTNQNSTMRERFKITRWKAKMTHKLKRNAHSWCICTRRPIYVTLLKFPREILCLDYCSQPLILGVILFVRVTRTFVVFWKCTIWKVMIIAVAQQNHHSMSIYLVWLLNENHQNSTQICRKSMELRVSEPSSFTITKFLC